MSQLLIKNIKQLCQIREPGESAIPGSSMSYLPTIEQAYLLIEDGLIADYGNMEHAPQDSEHTIDASDRIVLPTFCDSHTHIVYAESREHEFVDRIHGLTYEEIAQKGGGILNSATRLQVMSEDQLFDRALVRLNEVIGLGTGAIEIKSGYGLNTESEIKMLRVIQRLKSVSPIPIKATFLGAHAIPLEYKENRSAYINLIINEMLPQIAKEHLADYIDVFCDRGFFTVEETDQILKAGAKYGLQPKIHANELAISGGVQVGVKNNAISVDHLECMSETEIQVLQDSNTIPTMLPGTSFFLGIDFSPAREMLEANLPVALASDYNPGSSPSGRMPFIISLACIKMKMTPEEAINAATMNAAAAMEVHSTHGSITTGKVGSIILTKPVPNIAFLPYAFGSDWIEKVVINGKVFSNI